MKLSAGSSSINNHPTGAPSAHPPQMDHLSTRNTTAIGMQITAPILSGYEKPPLYQGTHSTMSATNGGPHRFNTGANIIEQMDHIK